MEYYPKKRIAIAVILLLLPAGIIFGQKKSELLGEIQMLKMELDSTKALVSRARNNEKMSFNKASALETQVGELQEANATLLQNLNSFAQVSSKNSDAINQALGSLEQKENQLKSINDAISTNDSTAIVVLTNTKKTLGEDARVSVSNGSIIISATLEMLFGDTSNADLAENAETWLGKIASVLKSNPNMDLTIEGLSMTGELNVAANQANSVAGMLIKNFEIAPERLNTLGRDGNFKEGINLKIHPKYDQFYFMVKNKMKNNH